MSFLYGLKLICDLCFYLTFANIICLLANRGNLVFSLPFFAVAAFAGGLLQGKKLFRFIPLVVFVPLFYYAPQSWLCYMLLIPPCLYVAYSLYKPMPDLNGMMYAEIFSLYLKMIIAVVVLALLGFSEETQRGIFSFTIVFILGAIVLMRMTRHDKEILEETRFKIINSLSVIGVTALVFIVSNKEVLAVFFNLLSTAYSYIIVPILELLLTVIVYILWHVFLKHLEPITGINQLDRQWEVDLGGDFTDNTFDTITGIPFPPILTAAFYLLIISLGALVIYKLFKRLRNTYSSSTGGKGAFEKHTYLGTDKAKTKPRQPKENNQIRRIYKNFLDVCRSVGIPVSLCATSEEIALKSGKFFREEESAKRLREIYIDARYGEKEFDKSDIKECKDIYTKFKNKK